MVGCSDDGEEVIKCQEAFGTQDFQAEQLRQSLAEDVEKRGLRAQERAHCPEGDAEADYRKTGVRRRSAKHVGTPWVARASAVVQYDDLGRERAWA
jgi:hypothetical protein